MKSSSSAPEISAPVRATRDDLHSLQSLAEWSGMPALSSTSSLRFIDEVVQSGGAWWIPMRGAVLFRVLISGWTTIHGVFVLPEHRRKGIATSLLNCVPWPRQVVLDDTSPIDWFIRRGFYPWGPSEQRPTLKINPTWYRQAYADGCPICRDSLDKPAVSHVFSQVHCPECGPVYTLAWRYYHGTPRFVEDYGRRLLRNYTARECFGHWHFTPT